MAPGIGIGIRVGGKGGGTDWVAYFATRSPSDLLVTIDSDTQVTLSWVNNGTADYTGHKVYISTDNITFTLNKIVVSIGTSTTVTGLTQGTLYYFYIKAYKGSNESAASNTDYGSTFVTAEESLTARMGTAPTLALRGLISDTLKEINANGGGSRLDYIVFYNLHTLADSFLNWLSASFNHSKGADTITWTIKQGIAGDGIAGFINTNNKIGDGQATQDDNFWGLFVRTSDGLRSGFGGSFTSGAARRYWMTSDGSADKLDIWNNSNSGDLSISNDNISKLTGLFVIQRTANNIDEIWYNGVKQTVTGGNIASSGVTGCNEYIGCGNVAGTAGNFNTKQWSSAVKGKSLSAAQHLALYNAIVNFNTFVGETFGRNTYFTSTGSDFAILGSHNINAAIYYNGKTYISFQGTNDNPYIITYKHITKTWSPVYLIGTNPLPDDDGHGEPAILIDDLGYIHCFFGCHYGPMKYSKSNASENITAWTAQTDPVTGLNPSGASYPQVFQVTGGDFYLFYRGGTTEGWRYKKSTDRGLNWSAATDYIVDGDNYYSQTRLIGGKFHCVYHRFPNTAGTGVDRFDIYYAYMDPTDEVWHNIDGDVLTLPLDENSDCKAYDSGLRYVPMVDIDLDSNGYPIISFGEGADVVGVYDLCVIKYNGSSWNVPVVVTTTENWRNTVSSIDIRSDTWIQLYLTVDDDGAVGGDIEKWESTDGGVTWAKLSTILTGKFLDPIKVYNGIANEKIVVFSYKGNVNWDNDGYLYGDNGFV